MGDEIDFLLEHVGRYLVTRPESKDILSVFAGLRPLVTAKHGGLTSSLSFSMLQQVWKWRRVWPN